MRRNIAFFISSNDENSNYFLRAKNHFKKLSDKFGLNLYETKFDNLYLAIIYEDHLSITENVGNIEFPIGNLGNQPLYYDRFLKVLINNDKIAIVNDYAGSIPVFYSTRNHISLSNIEPCVVLDSKTTPNDISYENIYGFMRYMHFIWDETAYKHIYVTLPDSITIFNLQDFSVESKYLKTVKSSKENIDLSDEEVADKLNELNDYLVYRSLAYYEQIILPLSAGYDSRMILSACSKKKEIRDKLYCFSYGTEGSVDVEAARRLTSLSGVKWEFIDLPLKFLTKEYLFKIHDIFGSSLHMHGMYQLEFINEIKKRIKISENGCLTSGFMTGVPAGQHNSLLAITSENTKLTNHMNKFSQSKYWTDTELEMFEAFKGKNYIEKAEERFRIAFNRFDGDLYQKSVMFDIWTRQRNFISYYPRTLEWIIPTVSPHMTPDYANFFMSLSKKHLDDRYAVELMFKKHYPHLARVFSNSNGIKAIDNIPENLMIFIARVLRKFKLNEFLPMRYKLRNYEFNIPAIRFSGVDSIYPLLAKDIFIDEIIDTIIPIDVISSLYNRAYRGDITSYEKLVSLQALALSLIQLKEFLKDGS